jgi:hypothetical protein
VRVAQPVGRDMESEVGSGDGFGPDRLPEPAVGQVPVVIGDVGSGGAGSVNAAVGAAAGTVGGEGVAAVLAAAAPGPGSAVMVPCR